MINPISQAFNLFFHILENLPAPIFYLLTLSLALSVIGIIVHLVFRG